MTCRRYRVMAGEYALSRSYVAAISNEAAGEGIDRKSELPSIGVLPTALYADLHPVMAGLESAMTTPNQSADRAIGVIAQFAG
jgi:hypothetical protein